MRKKAELKVDEFDCYSPSVSRLLLFSQDMMPVAQSEMSPSGSFGTNSLLGSNDVNASPTSLLDQNDTLSDYVKLCAEIEGEQIPGINSDEFSSDFNETQSADNRQLPYDSFSFDFKDTPFDENTFLTQYPDYLQQQSNSNGADFSVNPAPDAPFFDSSKLEPTFF